MSLDAPVVPLNMSAEQYRLRQLEGLADQGQCAEVLGRVELLLNHPNAGASAFDRRVLFTKARCLSKLGRGAEAQDIRDWLQQRPSPR
jgi:hypothetical protein